MTILVTGGAGFIGSHFVKLLLRKTKHKILVLDKLTYAGRKENLGEALKDKRVEFWQGDICDWSLVNELASRSQATINFAAETHVDNSIRSAFPFVDTNVTGTQTLLEGARKHGHHRFLQISTDEVYGSIPEGKFATEEWPLKPTNPYSASKASAEHLCMAYYHTHGLPVIITRSCNNFGPNQHQEKFIPTVIRCLLRNQVIPVYGDGENERQWIYVEDNCLSIYHINSIAPPGSVHNIARFTYGNLDIIDALSKIMGKKKRIKFVKDRKGHDRRYAMEDVFAQPIQTEHLLTTIAYYKKQEGA